jgi:N-acetylglutamate synthase-like GNAT family acetyltransferase
MIQMAPATTGTAEATRHRLRLREATSADRDRLWDFITRAGLEAAGTLEAGTRFWLVEDAEAQIVVSTGIEYGAAAALLRSTAVDPSYRGRGLALACYEFRFALLIAEGIRIAYGFSDTPSFMLRTGWQSVPVAELVEALPGCHQVAHFARIGWLPSQHAFRQDLASRWDEPAFPVPTQKPPRDRLVQGRLA